MAKKKHQKLPDFVENLAKWPKVYEPAADVVGVDAVASFWIGVAIDEVIVVAEDLKDSTVEGTEESAIVAGSGKKVVESFVVAGFGFWVFGHLKKNKTWNNFGNKQGFFQ